MMSRMECDVVRDLLPLYVDGGASAESRALVEAHLALCPDCRAECEALKDPAYANLIQSTWALIGHEKAATLDPEDGMFTPKTEKAFPDLEERIRHFAEIGRSC